MTADTPKGQAVVLAQEGNQGSSVWAVRLGSGTDGGGGEGAPRGAALLLTPPGVGRRPTDVS